MLGPAVDVQPAFVFPDLNILPSAPDPPTQPYHLSLGSGKLQKEHIVREFMAVETKVHNLEHINKVLIQQNKTLLLRAEGADRRCNQLEAKFETMLKAVWRHLKDKEL
jgi:hypothetical protein